MSIINIESKIRNGIGHGVGEFIAIADLQLDTSKTLVIAWML